MAAFDLSDPQLAGSRCVCDLLKTSGCLSQSPRWHREGPAAPLKAPVPSIHHGLSFINIYAIPKTVVKSECLLMLPWGAVTDPEPLKGYLDRIQLCVFNISIYFSNQNAEKNGI